MYKNTSGTANKMTLAATHAGDRIAWMLKSIYRDCVAERVSRDIGVEPRTVKSWLGGQVPNGTHLIALCNRYGRSFTDFVTAPAVAGNARIDSEIAALRVRADLLEMELKAERLGARNDCGNGSHGE